MVMTDPNGRALTEPVITCTACSGNTAPIYVEKKLWTGFEAEPHKYERVGEGHQLKPEYANEIEQDMLAKDAEERQQRQSAMEAEKRALVAAQTGRPSPTSAEIEAIRKMVRDAEQVASLL